MENYWRVEVEATCKKALMNSTAMSDNHKSITHTQHVCICISFCYSINIFCTTSQCIYKPLICIAKKEVAQNIAGHKGVIINRTRARELGISDGSRVLIESATGHTEGVAVLREGIRPDTLLMIGQFDHWITPFARDLKLPSLNSLSAIAMSLTDSTGSSADLVRVNIRPAAGTAHE